MIPLKLPPLKIVMMSVLQDLTRNITNQKAIKNLFKILENLLLIRNLQGLIRSPASLKRRILDPNKKSLLTTKKPHVNIYIYICTFYFYFFDT